MASLTKALYGHELPKQFAALDGDRTLLQQTMDRIAPMIPPWRTVVVVSAAREEIARTQLRDYPGVEIISQPLNLGTGPGILLPLVHVMARDPNALVTVFPSDHHVRRPEPFLKAVERGLQMAGLSESGVALLGAAAERPATDLGWIVRGERIGQDTNQAYCVHRFIEKPPEPVAMLLLGSGSLWNTMVLTGGADALWTLSRRHIPEQWRAFDRYLPHVTDGRGPEALHRMYRDLPPADFSREVLQVARGLAVVPVIDSGWFDCGTPERLIEYLAGIPDHAGLLARIQTARSGLRKLPASVEHAAA